MGEPLLKTLGGIAGIGGLALGVFFLLFRDLLKKIAAPDMTKQQWFKVTVIFMVLVWTVALAGILAWFLTTRSSNQALRPAPPPAYNNFVAAASQLALEGRRLEGKDVHDVIAQLHPIYTNGLAAYNQLSPFLQEADREPIRLQYENLYGVAVGKGIPAGHRPGEARDLAIQLSTKLAKLFEVKKTE